MNDIDLILIFAIPAVIFYIGQRMAEIHYSLFVTKRGIDNVI